MVATTIGIRELKADAPRLVRRAARGERIVITRYGKPTALLGPPPRESDLAATPRREAWQTEKRAFETLLPKLRRRYEGRWVAVLARKVVAASADHEALFQRVWRKHPNRAFHIGWVGDAAPAVEFPGIELE